MLSLGKRLRLRRRALVALPLAVLLPVAAIAATDPVSTIGSDHITESSALAVSRANSGYVYTINDDENGHKLIVYTLNIKAGGIRRETTIQDKNGADIEAVDPEALAIDRHGNLWIGDTGADGKRNDPTNPNAWTDNPPTLYKIPEPGAGPDQSVKATAYPITYANGAHYDVETLLINPNTDKKFLIRKEPDKDDGTHPNRRLQFSTLTADQPNTPSVKESYPDISGRVSDGSFSPNGKWAVLRNGGHTAYVYDPSLAKWKLHAKVRDLPDMKQAESLSFHPDGTRFLIGSEGDHSPLYWIGFNQSKGEAN